MTPLKKAPGCTSLLVERQKKVQVAENGGKGDAHVAGGAHQGLVINKREGGTCVSITQKGNFLIHDSIDAGVADLPAAQLALEFRVFLVSAQTGKHIKESRTLRFWCTCDEHHQATLAQDFFKHLVSPNDFPRGWLDIFQTVDKIMIFVYNENSWGFKGFLKSKYLCDTRFKFLTNKLF
jgi:hypothetical protein